MIKKQTGLVSVFILVLATILIGGGIIGDHYYNKNAVEKARLQKQQDEENFIVDSVVESYRE